MGRFLHIIFMRTTIKNMPRAPEKPKPTPFEKINPVIPGTDKFGLGPLLTGKTRAEVKAELQARYDAHQQQLAEDYRRSRTPSFVEQMRKNDLDTSELVRSTKAKQVNRAMSQVNTEITSDNEKYFPEKDSAENLEIVKNNLTTHLLFHLTSQNGLGSLESMRNLITHDLHYAELIGGFEDNQRRKLQIIATLKLNEAAKYLRDNPDSALNDSAPNVAGDVLVFLTLLGVDPAADVKISQALGSILRTEATMGARTLRRLDVYDNDAVMTQFLDGFSETDQELIAERRPHIQAHHDAALARAREAVEELQVAEVD